MWYELLRYFSRKELVKLQFGNRFFKKAIRELKLPALHLIENLFILRDDEDNTACFVCNDDCFNEEEDYDDKIIRIQDFCPPNYVRFSSVILCTLVMGIDFVQRLKQHKIVFNNCAFGFYGKDVQEKSTTNLWIESMIKGFLGRLPFLNYILPGSEEYPPTILSADDTMKMLMEDVFTDCENIKCVLTDQWPSIRQLKLCSISGVYNCGIVYLSGDKMVLSADDPFFESVLEWLQFGEKTERRMLVLKGFVGYEVLLRKLMTEFANDAQPHFYVLNMYDLDANFFVEFAYFHNKNTTTGEEMISRLIVHDNNLLFSLVRRPTG
ncbi:hypothetical protein DdX_05838 [Ditylenchus destructor]|uniref:Uncharacterized protein n=1 Tax=Ditylenchus destructor TaxID=166010 RepID=A0AAD4R6Z5_9BILA|nr:hypothetical protein DdX_05838 [Ditylenchus destructor]